MDGTGREFSVQHFGFVFDGKKIAEEKNTHTERRILVDIGFSLDTHTSMKEREM